MTGTYINKKKLVIKCVMNTSLSLRIANNTEQIFTKVKKLFHKRS